MTRYWCDDCNKSLEASEVRSMRAGSGTLSVCPVCERMVRLEAATAVREAPSATSFAATLASAFGYPFRGSTLLSMVAVALVAAVLALFGTRGLTLGLAVEASYLAQVVRTTALGEDAWTFAADDGAGLGDWVRPLARYLGVLLLVALPPLWAALVADRADVALALIGAGLLYLPAGLVAASYESGGCLGPLNPLPALALIARIPGAYALTLLFVGLSAAATVAIVLVWARVAAAVDAIPLLPALLGMVVSLIGPTMAARMLGLLVREHSEAVFGV